MLADFECTGWQSLLQNLFITNLPNLIGWLQQTLRKEQKLFWSSFYLGSRLSEKNKQHFEKKKKNQNVLYVVIGALVSRARSKISSISIYQTCPTDCKRPLERSNIVDLTFQYH